MHHFTTVLILDLCSCSICSELQLQPRCADQMHRVLRQRAVSVHLNPRIEEECRQDLGRLCNEKIQRGEVTKLIAPAPLQ